MGKSSSRVSSGHRARGRTEVFTLFHPEQRPKWVSFLGFVIRARAEIIILTCGVLAWVGLYQWTDSGIATWSILGGTVLVVLVVPHSRRFTLGRVWCLVDRHRLRTCLRQAKVRTMNMDGALPFLLWARPTKTGECVWLVIRAGSAAEDLEAALNYIAPACWAREARLRRYRKLTTIVGVEIIRRDPLGKPEPIASPLSRLTAKFTGQNVTAEGSESIQAATVTDITSARVNGQSNGDGPLPDYPGTVQRKPAKPEKKQAPAKTTVAEPAPYLVGGEDLSDYID